MPAIAVINGPNLNLLGTRQPHIYGHTSLADIRNRLAAMLTSAIDQKKSRDAAILLDFMQSDAEHELIGYVHSCQQKDVAFIIINAAAYTHTSIALADALSAVALPYIELHISNTHSREHFRHFSYLSSGAYGIITGFGHYGYDLALQAALHYLQNLQKKDHA